MPNVIHTLSAAADLDRQDPLARFRQQFALPLQADGQSAAIYLCGNSLGPMPHAVRDVMNRTLDDWATLGVRGTSRVLARGFPMWTILHHHLLSLWALTLVMWC